MEFDLEQRAAILHPAGPLRVVAGPGTGKTRVLTERIRHFVQELGFAPHNVLAVTFTVKAAHEMRRRLFDLLGRDAAPLTIKTIHALGLQLMRRNPRVAGVPSAFELAVAPALLLRQAELALHTLRLAGHSWSVTPEEALHQTALLKASQPDVALGIMNVNPMGSTIAPAHPLAAFQRVFDRGLREQGLVTLDDLPLLALRVCRDDPLTMEAVRATYRAVFVDEYQDVSETQRQLIDAVAHGPHPILTVVGDDDQSIYGWRGAHPDILGGFDKRVHGAQTLYLRTNYRSTSNIVEASSALIAHNIHRIDKRLQSVRKSGEPIQVSWFHSSQAEVSYVARAVEDLIVGKLVSLSDVAVLGRNNDVLERVRTNLLQAGIPVMSDGTLKSAAAQELLALLRTVLEGPADRYFGRSVNVGRRRARRSDWRAIFGDAALVPEAIESQLVTWLAADVPDAREEPHRAGLRLFVEAVTSARAALHVSSPGDVVDRLVSSLGLPTGSSRSESSNVVDLAVAIDLVREVAATRGHALGREAMADMLSELDQMRLLSEDSMAGVQLLTVHRAKGLEFECVYLLGVQDDTFPNMRFAAIDANVLEEERRLFYVAMTRAKKGLFVSGHEVTSHLPDRAAVRPLSKATFLRELPAAYCTERQQ